MLFKTKSEAREKLIELDGWLRNRLLYCIWSQPLSGDEKGAETEKPYSTWC